MVAVLAVGACASPVPSPPRAESQAPPRPGGGAQPGRGPALGVFRENATRVTAIVRDQRTYAIDSLPPKPAVGEPGTSIQALTIEIQNARAARGDVPMGPAAGTIEAFSRDPLPAIAVGQRIEATVTLIGDTLASRWLISDIRILPN